MIFVQPSFCAYNAERGFPNSVPGAPMVGDTRLKTNSSCLPEKMSTTSGSSSGNSDNNITALGIVIGVAIGIAVGTILNLVFFTILRRRQSIVKVGS